MGSPRALALIIRASRHRTIVQGSGATGLTALVVGIVALLAGCAFNPAVHRTVPVPQAAQHDALEITIEAARSVDLPPPTKVDKANGVVEFGAFGTGTLGYTAQVRVRSDGQLDVTVERGSIYVPLDVDQEAQSFVTALESRLQAAR
jgi:hypothetical protein